MCIRDSGRATCGAVDGGDSAASGPCLHPPLLTGGVLHLEAIHRPAVVRGLDFLTVSLPDATAGLLLAESEHSENGHGFHSFRRSEERLIMGGRAWRRWEPGQPCKLWGTGYESWETSGAASDSFGMSLRGRPCKPTRVDAAWDFSVPETFTSDDFLAAIAAHVEGQILTTGISGQAGVNTRYVGSPQSEKRLRIYRKDLQDPCLGAMLLSLIHISEPTRPY